MKTCCACRELKPLDDFHRDASRGDGRQRRCKACISSYAKARYQENPERQAALTRAWREANPERHRTNGREWKRNNREQMAVWWRQWADKNREHLAAYDRTYKAANRQRYRDYQNARRARRLKQFVEDVESAVLFERDQGICGICGEAVDPLDFQMDHRVPLCQGGEHSYANTQVSHPRCNLRKARGPRLAPSTPATTLAPLGTTNQGAEPWSN